MKKGLLWVLIVACSFSAPIVNAQDTVPLRLQDALDAALKSNSEIKTATLDEEIARARFRQTDAVFLPQITVSYTAMSTNNPLNAFGFKLQQQSILQSDFNPELLNDPSATQNFMTKAEWQQPILNMDMLYKRKAAHRQVDIYALKAKRTKEYLAFEVQKAYLQLQLAHQAAGVLEEARQTVRAIHAATQNRFEKGFLQRSDVLNVQVQTAAVESRLAEARSNVENASGYLGLLMGAETGVVYTVDPAGGVVMPEQVATEVPDSRADLQATWAALDAQDMMVSSSKMSYLPSLNAFAEYMFNDAEALGFGSDSYLVGARLSWSLFKGMATRNTVAAQRIERDKAEEQLAWQKAQSQLELSKTHRQLQDASYALQQQETAVRHAEEALRILQNRYDQGLVTTNDILQAQTQLSQQKLSHAQAVYRHNMTYAYLLFLTTPASDEK